MKKGNLFLLIKSLSKAEKRYFKLYSSIGKTDTNYIRLFNIIEKQKEYDEDKIKKIFKGESFISQLHVTKIYLTELILKALRNYHTKNSKNVLILNLLRDIEILFNRELYDLCFYKIKKAEKIAEDYEKLPLLNEILYWKRKLALSMFGPDSEKINGIIINEKNSIDKMQTLNSYWNYTINFFDYSNDKKFLRNTFFKNSENAKTLQAKILYHHTLYTYNFVNGNIKKAEESISDLIELLEQHPLRIEDDPQSYITAISNKIGLHLSTKNWKAIPELIKKMEHAPIKYNLVDESKFTVRLRLRLFNVELEMYRDTKQLEKGVLLIEKIESYIRKHNKNISKDYLILFYYQFAYIFYLKKNYTEALKWLNEIININFNNIRSDVQSYARILNLIIHFELNNIIVLRYAVDSCRRFFKKKKISHPYYGSILKLFSNLSLSLKEKYPHHLKKAYQEIFSGTETDAIEQMQDYIDLKSWLEEKLEMKN